MSRLPDETSVYKEQMARWIEALGLPQHQPSNDVVETILGFTRELLRERSLIQLSEDAVILSQYSLFLQQKTNECQTFLRWSNQINNRLLGDDRSQLNRWVKQAELRLDRVQYLARRVELVGQSISNLVRTRYNERNNQ